MSLSFDVAVVGDGVAGLSAAITAAQANLRCLLLSLDKPAKAKPGETLHPGVAAVLERLGVADDVAEHSRVRHAGFMVASGGSCRLEEYGRDSRGQWLGYQISRLELEAILLRRAADAGVVIRKIGSEPRPVRAGAGFCGVLAGDEYIPCRTIVDASGVSQWLRRTGALRSHRITPLLVARYGWDRSSGSDLPVFEFRNEGWLWRAPVDTNRSAWVRLSFGRDARSDARGRGADVSWRIVPRCAGPGWFLAGDAACVLDPACSHGVLRAIMSGMLASHYIAAIQTGQAENGAVINAYCKWMVDWFCSDAAALLAMYAGSPCAPDWLDRTALALRRISI